MFETTTCSQCKKLCEISDSYKNNKTGKIWCSSCFTKEKKIRIQKQFKRI